MSNSVGKRYRSITYLRVFSMLLIAYVHLGPARNSDWFISKSLDAFLFTPLQITMNGAALGVSIFFLMSGFLIYPMKTSIKEKLLKIFLRLVLPMVGSMACFFLLSKCFELFSPNYWSQFSLQQWINTTFLIDFLNGRSNVLNGVLWYMVPSFFFTLMFTILHPIAEKQSGILKIVLIYDLALFTISITVPSLASTIPFAFMPVFGVIIRQIVDTAVDYNKKIKSIIAEILLTYILMLISFRLKMPLHYSNVGGTYLSSFAYASLLFVVTLGVEDYIPEPCKVVKLLSNISYEFYILHSMVGGLVMSQIGSVIECFTVEFLLGVLASIGFSVLVYHLLERIIVNQIVKRKVTRLKNG